MIVNFLTEYYEKGREEPIRELSSIAVNYLKSYFILDLIPLVPVPHLGLNIRNFDNRHFYILKVIRLI